MTGKRRAKPAGVSERKSGPEAASAPATLGAITKLADPKRSADCLALISVALCVVLAYGARNELNPDGVSYLDLAAALRSGAYSSFVQGYWSPLYPALVALVSALTGHDSASLVRDVHVLNLFIAMAAIGAVWWTVRPSSSVAFVRMSFGALLLCSWRPPRVDAITPDLLLLALMIVITSELVLNHGRRWLLLGVLFGLAFLAKTSAWPWLLVATLLRLGFAKRHGNTRAVLLSSGVALAVMLLWIVPLSVQSRSLSVGDAGALNACWYLRKCDSRTPDTHTGEHRAYRTSMYNGTVPITWATFGQTQSRGDAGSATPNASTFRFTYEPWSDPSAWAKGVTTRAQEDVQPTKLIEYWLMLASYVFGYWLLAMILAVLAPAAILFWPKGAWTGLRTNYPDALLTMLLGLIGIGQFIAVHAEPRLVAPFALMFALAWLMWLCETPADAKPAPSLRAQLKFGRWFTFLSIAGLLTSIPFALRSINDSYGKEVFAHERVDAINRSREAQGQAALRNQRIVVIGYGIPVIADAYRLGNYIVGQILPASALKIDALPRDEQKKLVEQIFGGSADVAWFSNANGGFRMVPLSK